MKTKVVHCVDDDSIGGVKSALQSLCDSTLAESFDFSIQHLDLTRHSQPQINADIICLHGASSWRKLIGIVLLKWHNPKAKLVLQEHHYSQGFVEHNLQSTYRFYWMLRLSYRLMDRVIAISPSQQQWMLSNKLLSSAKVVMLGQGRDLSSFIDFQRNSAVQTPDTQRHQHIPVIAAFGRFHPQKGFDLLIKALHLLPENYCHLKIAGGGEQYIEYRQLAAGLNNVEFVGVINHVAAFLSQCDAVIIPSRWEPFGLVFIESRVMNKVIISSSVDGLGDQIKAEQSAPCLPINQLTPQSIAASIRQFVEQAPWHCAPDSDAASKPISDDFNTNMTVEELDRWQQQQWLTLLANWQTLLRSL